MFDSDSIKTQRIVASPMQTATVSVSGLCPSQLQGTQRLIVSGTPAQAKAVVAGTAVQGKTISPAQLNMIRQANLKQQLTTMRLQTAGIAGAQIVKTTTVSIAGQSTLQLQFTQAQPRAQVNVSINIFYFIKPFYIQNGNDLFVFSLFNRKEIKICDIPTKFEFMCLFWVHDHKHVFIY